MNPERRLVFFSALVLLWLFFVMGGYYLYHKPFTTQQVTVWITAGFQTLTGLVIIASAGGMGLAILSHFQIESGRSTPSVLPSLGMGLGVLSTFYTILAWVVGIRWYISLALLGLIFGIFARWVKRWLINLFEVIRELEPKKSFERALAVLLGFLVVAGWLTAVAPPLAFDALVYHLSLPVLYLQGGKFESIPGNVFWGMPQLGEMLYTLAMSVSGLEAGPVLGWMIGLCSLIGICEILKIDLTLDGIWVSLAAVLCGISLTESLAWAYVDWVAFFYGMCVIQMFWVWMITHQRRYLLLAAIFCGFALGTKYTAGVLIIAACLAIIFFDSQRFVKATESGRKLQLSQLALFNAQSLLLFLVICLLVSLPWWLKNLFAVGQPFYPLILPAGEMTTVRIRFYTEAELFGSWWTAIFLPITSTFLGIQGKMGFSASIGPLFLLLAPFSVWLLREQARINKPLIKLNLLFAVIGWVVWGVGSRLAGYLIQSRLYWAIFPSLAILSGLGYQKLSSIPLKTFRLRFVLNSMVVFVLVLTAIEAFTSMVQKRVLDYWVGAIDAQTYLTHNLGWHYVALRHVQTLQGKTLLLFEPRSFYCLPGCDGDEILDEWYQISINSSIRPTSIVQSWKGRGYAYVLVFHQGAEFVRETDLRYQKSQWQLFDQLIPMLSKKQSFGNAYTLYHLP